ncbi:MAG: hypothetical protein IKN61_00485 [Bacteroidaceae bacterium]|nr:hypothetical protein [Bacteroidaceae bacterium]
MKKIVIAFALYMLCQMNISAQTYNDSINEPVKLRLTGLDENACLTGQVIGLEPCESICGRYIYDTERRTMRIDVGYSALNNFGPLSESIGWVNGLHFSLDLMRERLYFGIGGNSYMGLLKSDNFFYDRKEDFNWQKDERVDQFIFSIKTGVKLIDKPNFGVVPNIGFGVATLEQSTGKRYNTESNTNYIKSAIEGFHTEAGLFAYYSLFDCSTFWITSSDITLGFNAARTVYEKIGPVYSLSAYLTISLKLNLDYL